MVWAKPNFHFRGLSDREIAEKLDQIRNTAGYLDLPDSWVYLLSCIKILALDYGFVRSTEAGVPCDGDGKPIPLYTYPMIEYLAQLDLRAKDVFEFGAGQSSLYWRARTRSVVSVENNPEWYKRLSAEAPANHQVVFASGAVEFCRSILAFDRGFDIIVVDAAENRYECAASALRKLNEGGFIILDNADWHFQTAQLLREHGLIQIDMCGFKPTKHHTSTTSLFLHRAFDPAPAAGRQPSTPLGGLELQSGWDHPLDGRDGGEATRR